MLPDELKGGPHAKWAASPPPFIVPSLGAAIHGDVDSVGGHVGREGVERPYTVQVKQKLPKVTISKRCPFFGNILVP